MTKSTGRMAAPTRIALAVALALGMIAPTAASAASAAGSASVGNPRLNGYWNIDADARAVAQSRAKAELTPMGQDLARQNAEAAQARLARGEPVGLGSYTCARQSLPFIVGTSEPWQLIVTRDEVVQIAERRQMPPRHMYTDGRAWPDLSTLPPAAGGYSIAHWEGNDLVVETRGLASGGIQGGGLKGPKSVLTERASLSPDGNRLTWTYTWTDPELLAKPFVLALEYDRAPPHTYAYTHPCDPAQGAGRTVAAPDQD